MTDGQRRVRLGAEELPGELMGALLGVDRAIHASEHLCAELRELVCLHVSQINGCAYCVDMHGKELLAQGVAPEKLHQLPVWRESTLYDAGERAALAWAESLTSLRPHPPGDADLAAALEQFDSAALAALTLAITQINSWNRIAVGFGYPPGRYRAGSLAKMLERLPTGI